MRGLDPRKDQSYFLGLVRKQQLGNVRGGGGGGCLCQCTAAADVGPLLVAAPPGVCLCTVWVNAPGGGVTGAAPRW